MSLKLETVSKMKLTDGDMKVLLSEKYSTYGKEILYVPIPDQNKVIPITTNNSLSGHIQGGLRKFFQEIFLPQGYPTSVSSDYTQYQIWDTAQAFCSTITGTLATHSVMKGVGVGNIEATPLAATITWVLKEVTGNFGRIAFAWWKGTSLDADSKRWRLVADCLNDAAICLEVALPLFEGYTTYVLCASTAMKSIVGVAGGATRAALTQHQAIRGNLADVAAKDGSQETAVNIIASFAAIMIISLVGQNIWPVFFTFTLFHIISNYLAVSSVCLNTFNTTRYLNTIGHFLKCGNIPSPKQVNSEEPVFFFQNRITDEMTCGFKIKVGESLKYLVESGKISLKQLEVAIEVHQESKYLIVFNMDEKCVHIILNDTATSEDVNCGYFNAIVFGTILSRVKNINCQAANFISKEIYNPSFLKYNENDPDDTPSIEVFREIYETTVILWEKFHKASIIEGWNLDKNLIISQEFRAVWNFEKKEK